MRKGKETHTNHKVLSAFTDLTASPERGAAKLQGWFGLMEPHSWTPGLGTPAPSGGHMEQQTAELLPPLAPAPSSLSLAILFSVSPKDSPFLPQRLLWPFARLPFLRTLSFSSSQDFAKWLKQAV